MLSKILGKLKDTIIPPKSIIQLIEQDFAPLEKECKGIVQRVVRYIADGEGEEVLLKIKGIPNAASIMKMTMGEGYGNPRPKSDCARYRLLKDLNDPTMLFRLGNTYKTLWDAQPRQIGYSKYPEDGAEWIEVIFYEWFMSFNKYNRKNNEDVCPWDAAFMENTTIAAGLKPDFLVRCFLWYAPDLPGSPPPVEQFSKMNGIADCFARHPETVREGLRKTPSASRIHALETINKYNVNTNPFISDIARLAVEDSKRVREMALPILQKTPSEAIECLKTIAETGTNNERFHSVKALSRLGGAEVRPFLEGRLTSETSKKNLEEISRVLGFMDDQGKDEEKPVAEVKFDLPPVLDFPTTIPLNEESKQAFKEAILNINEEVRKNHTKWWDRADPKWRRGPREISDPIPLSKVSRAIAHLETGEDAKKAQGLLVYADYMPGLMIKPFSQFVSRKDLSLVHGWRLLHLLNELKNDEYPYLLLPLIMAMSGNEPERQDLRAHAKACAIAGYSTDKVTHLFFSNRTRWRQAPDLPPDAIWPYFAENMEILEKELSEGKTGDFHHDYSLPVRRERVLMILASFPAIPSRLSTRIWEIALEGIKTERPLAQACLAKDPQMESRIIAALGDNKKDIRTIAAEWLGRVGTEAAIPVLKKAFVKEKHDEPKAEMLGALERLGASIDEFLNLDRLSEEAEKGLSKGIPKEMNWLPLESLPPLHWEKTSEAVKPEILKWFLVQACNLSKPEPSPLLRKYMALVIQAEREAFGEWVLDAWMTQDVKPKYTYEEASKLAEDEARQYAVYAKKSPQYYPNWNEDEHRKAALNRLLKCCLGSAMPSKGILAITGACAGPSIVPKVQRYLKQWYGMRGHQCKALIQMLSWVEHNLAIQLILAVGARFRTKGIQEEAEKYAGLIAERKGWTPEEMADRTVPSAGFDEDGSMEIDYGGRTFTARLAEDFSIVLMNSEGKEIKSLPDANKTEDEAEVKAQKAQFSASKKELKQVLQLQMDRLYEAMCTERAWRYEDWDLYLLSHPIVGRYCQQLVWLVERPDKTIASFRPLPDRTLVDYNDDDVACGIEDQVRLAHQSLVSSEQANAWLRHLEDYKITPLFEQFGRELYVLTEEKKEDTEINDFEGHMTESFRLRGRMNKLGYTRGEAGDGGWFTSYKKRFPGQKLEAVIEFTGGPLPEENRPVALLTLRFERIQEDPNAGYSYMTQPGVPLGSIPSVLLTECWNDMRLAAKDGMGFDPEWQKKSQY